MDCGCIFMLVSVGLGIILLIAGIAKPEKYAIIIGIVLIVVPFVALWISAEADSRRRDRLNQMRRGTWKGGKGK